MLKINNVFLKPILDTLHKRGVRVDRDVLREEHDLMSKKGYNTEAVLTFFENIVAYYSKSCIYPEYSVVSTQTGRWTTKNPNIQGFPKNRLRRAIVPYDLNDFFISCDYKQAEFVLLLSMIKTQKTEHMLKVYKEGVDLFYELSLLFDIPVSYYRDEVKKNVYAWMYGSSQVDDSVKKALFNIFGYENSYNLVKKEEKSLPGIEKLDNVQDYKQLNYYLQGRVADIVNRACVECYNEGYIPYIVIHDNIVFSVPEGKKTALERIPAIMNSISPPLKVQTKYGNNWYEVS